MMTTRVGKCATYATCPEHQSTYIENRATADDQATIAFPWGSRGQDLLATALWRAQASGWGNTRLEKCGVARFYFLSFFGLKITCFIPL